MIDRVMCWALDHSKAAKHCDWKPDACEYIVISHRSYQLARDWWCESGIVGSAAEMALGGHTIGRMTHLGRIDIDAGFAWDGPSGPTFQTEDSMAGSLVHDFLYRLARQKKIGPDLRDEVDNLALRIWLQDGMYYWRARLWHRALRSFAWPAYEAGPDPVVIAK